MADGEAGCRVTITGRVQGVWFRGWTLRRAESLGLRGWVRNRRDGTVEAVFVGPPEAVEAMVAACREGPPAARVDGVAVVPAAPGDLAGLGRRFEQRDTE
ncbi:MAG: acylphosphatase [Alphaproteobacteria bacterium]